MRSFFAPSGARIISLLAVLGLGIVPTVRAQQTGTLIVTVRGPDSLPLGGSFVRSDRFGAVANEGGVARIELPARLVPVEVSHQGYESRLFEITIVAGVDQRYELVLDLRASGQRTALVSTRSNRRLADEPVSIRALGPDELTTRTAAHPTDLSRLFAGIPGIRPQAEVGPLDATRLRMNGLPGQYSGILVDGLPLLGLSPGAFGLMQLSPLAYDRAEWLRGPAGAYYGASAPGGVVNLISRRPARDEARIGINQSSEKGGDVLLWAGRRQTSALSGSVAADFHQQRLVDADDDGWGDLPRAIRISVRPRVDLDLPNGDGLSLTAGVGSEDRTGGFLQTSTGEDRYREERRTRKIDGTLSGHRLIGRTGFLNVAVMALRQSVSHRFDELRERDHRVTLFAETSYRQSVGRGTGTVGLAYQRETYRQRDLTAFDYSYDIPSLFASATYPVTDRVTGTVAGRCDNHSIHGLQCSPRVDLLVRATPEIDARLFGGTGYTSPTALADGVEPLGLHATIPVAVRAEHVSGGGVDVRWHRASLEIGAELSYTSVADPITVVPVVTDPAKRLRLLNLDEPTRVFAADLTASYQMAPFVLGAFYGFRDGSEGVPGATGRRPLDLTPKHQVGLSGGWKSPAATGTAVDVDVLYLGAQTVSDNPFRTKTPGYGIVNGVISQRSGRARLYLSAENVFDVKLGNYDSVFLATPLVGGRRTVTPWAPLRGRVLSLGALVDW